MKNKDSQEYKEPVTKEKLLKYMKVLEAIKVVPVKGKEEPILILKTLRPAYGLLGAPDEVVVHKGYFILSRGIKRIKTGSKTISCIAPAEVNYLKKFKISHSKEFLISNILDKKIQKMQDMRYITPARDLFRKYGILTDKRGKASKIRDIGKERREFVIRELKAITAGKRAGCSKRRIWDRWCDYVDEKYPDAENPDKLYFDYTTIWRDCRALRNCIKK